MSAAPSHETLVRILQLTQLIPRSPAQITVADLTKELAHLGFKVTSRTVQRDLDDIAKVLPLEKNDKGRPYGWKWARDAKAYLSAMSLQEALTLHLVNQYLIEFLPPNMLDELTPLFKQAKKTIENLGSRSQLKEWLDSISLEQPSLSFLAPKINLVVQQTLHEALFERKAIKALYKGQGADKYQSLVLHPVGLMYRGKVAYLGAMVADYEDIRLFALHRFKSAEIDYLNDARKPSISWKEYLAQGAKDFSSDGANQLNLVAEVSSDLALTLQETPLAKNQKIVEKQDKFILQVGGQNTWQFRWWILSQGSKIKILQPSFLAEEVKLEVEKMYQNYQGD